MAKLKADGQPVNGTTYAKLVGVSGRTARRDLQALAA
ncbi:HTH domain-containing protein [Streptomyces sp. TG1A-60]